MTEQECIEVFKELLDVPCEMLIKYDSVTTEEQKKALVKIRIAEDMAIKALEEIQQYRALGMTPELIEAMQGHNIAMINDLAEYQALGTVEELRVARDKQIEKKPKRHPGNEKLNYCPSCGLYYGGLTGFKYCADCGQKLDWSDEDE